MPKKLRRLTRKAERHRWREKKAEKVVSRTQRAGDALFALPSTFSALLLYLPLCGKLRSAVFESLDQAAEHPGDFFEPGLEFGVHFRCKQVSSAGQFQ